MKILSVILNAALVGFAVTCVATTAVQIGLLAFLWSNGTFTGDKMLRYAAAIYGLDLAQMPQQDAPADAAGQPDKADDREAVIKSRVENLPLLEERREAIQRGLRSVRNVLFKLRDQQELFETRKRTFDAALKQQEEEARVAAVEQVQQTLAQLRPQQAKTLIIRMLDARDFDDEDDVMADIVTILKSMPVARKLKIYSEFQRRSRKRQRCTKSSARSAR